MAAARTDTAALARTLADEARNGVFRPVYVLMGEEPFYPDLVCRAILDNCIDEFGKDFNETVCYGPDVTPDRIITEAREFPMMAERRLIVVKEAQLMKGVEDLAVYLSDPLDSTVLVLLFHKGGPDKRKALYKAAQKKGAVLDSPAMRDYEMPSWITEYYSSRGLRIEPAAASLLAEYAGTELSTIVVETDKLLKNLPEGAVSVSVADIEKNVGISRQFNVFELCKALSSRNATQALKIAAHLGSGARFQMPAAVSALYTYFSRILKYGALLSSGKYSQEDKARVLAGVNPYFYKEYDTAVRNFPVQRAMAVISLLCEYDYLGKGGDGGAASPDALLMELTARILNV